ncbi:MAG: bifunctional ADP-heptose synthase [Fimbriimonadaceae bacterium]|nr:bifunctional ADP-heptose synthase [Fimbriimonadaceae bacterium]
MSFAGLLDRMAGLRVLVIGDLMVDEYIEGPASRVSPEAPVLVIRRRQVRSVPGGAANVARNTRAFGAATTVVGLVGPDEAGDTLREALVNGDGCRFVPVVDPGRPTTRKTRVLVGTHQICRIDDESTLPAAAEQEDRLLEAGRQALAEADVLIMSDYIKGCLTERVVVGLIESARSLGVLSAVNAKPSSAHLYRGADLMTLNRSEIGALVGRDPRDLEEAGDLAREAADRLGLLAVAATMGDQGLALASPAGVFLARAPRVEVSDVAGAGDTVVSAAGLAVRAGGWTEPAARLAVEAGARVVRHSGVAAPSPSDLQELRSLA